MGYGEVSRVFLWGQVDGLKRYACIVVRCPGFLWGWLRGLKRCAWAVVKCPVPLWGCVEGLNGVCGLC